MNIRSWIGSLRISEYSLATLVTTLESVPIIPGGLAPLAANGRPLNERMEEEVESLSPCLWWGRTVCTCPSCTPLASARGGRARRRRRALWRRPAAAPARYRRRERPRPPLGLLPSSLRLWAAAGRDNSRAPRFPAGERHSNPNKFNLSVITGAKCIPSTGLERATEVFI